MHCDDKRTTFALKQFLLDSESELQQQENILKSEKGCKERLKLQARIDDLEMAIKDVKEQLLSM